VNKENELINKYIEIVFEMNRMKNLVSRKISRDDLGVLINESLLLKSVITSKIIIDAGSGSGLLSIPLALTREGKYFLVESNKGKCLFLDKIVNMLGLNNVEIYNEDIGFFLKNEYHKDKTVITRGFPKIEILVNHFKRGAMRELVAITGKGKIKSLEKITKIKKENIIEIPSRTEIFILKMENVSRETKKQ
jgi:16S rRNA G527 N7-methylase RsmG